MVSVTSPCADGPVGYGEDGAFSFDPFNFDYGMNQIWQTIQSDPEMKDQTTLLITNDHGRHLDGRKDGFVSHGDKCEGCRHISLLALGPDFQKDLIINTPAEMIDISATIAEMLGFLMPTSRGRVLTELTE